MKIPIKARKWLRTIHILFAAIMLGNMVVFLILSIAAAASEGRELVISCYRVMHVLSKTSVRASTIGTTVTGVLLSVWTSWGLFKYYWILAKEGLTLLVIGLNLWGMYQWTLKAMTLIQAPDEKMQLFMVQSELWIGIIIQLLALITLYIISVFKPWGKRVSTA